MKGSSISVKKYFMYNREVKPDSMSKTGIWVLSLSFEGAKKTATFAAFLQCGQKEGGTEPGPSFSLSW